MPVVLALFRSLFILVVHSDKLSRQVIDLDILSRQIIEVDTLSRQFIAVDNLSGQVIHLDQVVHTLETALFPCRKSKVQNLKLEVIGMVQGK